MKPGRPGAPTALVLGGLGDKTEEDLAAEHPTRREARTLAWISALPKSLFPLGRSTRRACAEGLGQ